MGSSWGIGAGLGAFLTEVALRGLELVLRSMEIG